MKNTWVGKKLTILFGKGPKKAATKTGHRSCANDGASDLMADPKDIAHLHPAHKPNA
jgi:hypothetical protein